MYSYGKLLHIMMQPCMDDAMLSYQNIFHLKSRYLLLRIYVASYIASYTFHEVSGQQNDSLLQNHKWSCIWLLMEIPNITAVGGM